jgi:type I site-specific restriction endonuclease
LLHAGFERARKRIIDDRFDYGETRCRAWAISTALRTAGWQTRINEDLRSKMKDGKIVFAGGPRKRTDRAGPAPAKRKRA